MSFRDIFDETRRKIGGAIGNQVDNFRVGLNLKQPKNLPLSLAQDALKLQSARRVLGKEGLGSAAGIREAGKGVLRAGVEATRAINQFNPGRIIAPKAYQRNSQIFKGIENRLAPRGNEVQKSLNTGFNFGARMAPYGAVEGAAIGAASKLLPRIAASKVGQFGIRRGADILSGQLLSTPEEIQNMGGGVKGRLKIAGMDVLGGTAMEGAGRVARPLVKTGGQKINLAKNVSKMGKELPSKVKVGENAFSYNRGGKTLEVPNEVAEFYIKNGRMPTETDILPKNYKFKGTTELRFQDGKFHGWDSDNDLFKAKIAQEAPSIGLSTKDISGDALSGEARKYKSADEFVKAQGTPVYHGGTKIDEVGNMRSKWGAFYMTDNPTYAKSYGGNKSVLNEMVITPKAKLADLIKPSDDLIKQIDEIISPKATGETIKIKKPDGSFVEVPKTKGGLSNPVHSSADIIQGIKDGKAYYAEMPEVKEALKKLGYDGMITQESKFGVNYGVWNKDVIKTKSQLTDIWKESQSLSTNKGAVTPLKVNKPQKGIRLPLKGEKATEGLAAGVGQGGKGIVEPQLNTSKFDISEQAKKNLNETVASIKPELEKVKGGVLKNEDVIDAAKASKILSREIAPEQTKKATAAVTRLRQEVAAGAEGKGLTKDFIENLKTLKSYSADAGRRLQAFNIKASPETSIKESVIADLVNLGKKSDELISAAKGVDFDNPKQVTDFYRKFVKPSFGEVLNEYRYINLLSSPQTHIVNAFSNLVQGTILNPATKLYSGAIDTIGSALTGKARQNYIGEVPAYTKGFVNSMGDAFRQAAEVFRGNKFVERPDINRLPTGKLGPGEYILRALEAGDVFFRTMIKGGELESLAYKASKSGKKVAQSVLDKQAADKAEYFVFRKALDPSNKSGQGSVLSAIDKMTESVYKLRNVPGVNWIIPFVQTPMNILKQGIEYSPAGISTLIGNTNKTEQLAKTLVGSTVMAGAGMVAMQGDSTWAAPTGEKEKEEFYATGRKPYSLKIGDNWVSYSKLGPLAYPIAMAAAVKYYYEQDPKASSTDSIDKATKMLGGVAGFFADQSYLTGMGDLLDIARGDQYAIKRTLSNLARQTVPLTSLQGWIARQVDPIYREGKTLTEQIKTGIPFLSKSVPAYTDPLGNPSVRKNNTFNSYSPINVNPADQNFEPIYQKTQQEKKANAEVQALKEKGKGTQALSNGQIAVVINDEVKKFDTKEEAQKAIDKDAFDKSDKKTQLKDGIYYYRDKNGDPLTMTEDEYNTKLRKAKMDVAYNNKDYKTWIKLAEEKLTDIEKQYAEADELTQTELLNEYQDLAAKIKKYQGYGGFTKGKAGKKFTGITLPVATAKIPVRQAKAPTFKNISSTPKIAIKTTKPKMISKSTLANLR